MFNLFRIARWEFVTRMKSRSFLVNTFIAPLIFASILYLPVFIMQYQPEISTKLIGIIDLSGKGMEKEVQDELNRFYRLRNQTREYMALKISVSNSKAYAEMDKEYSQILARRDSVGNIYNQIKGQRTEYYQNDRISNRENILRDSYEKLQTARDEKDLADFEAERFKTLIDSLYKTEAKKMADSLLFTEVLSAYLVFPSGIMKSGVVEYHSKNMGDFRETERFEKILQTIVTKQRILKDNIERSKLIRWLDPVNVKKYQLFPGGQREWDFYIQFYGPLISVFLLFISIFTAGGFLFSGVLLEKSNRIVEFLLSFNQSWHIMVGKIVGLGMLGLVQLLIWLLITLVLMAGNVIPTDKINYLTLSNAFLFMVYFVLGFLFYGLIFITVSSLSSSEYDAQQINQLLRAVAIFPILLSVIVLVNPNAPLIRMLSYIPFLTPSFMIMRIPLSSKAIEGDIFATIFLMMVAISLLFYFAVRIFRLAILIQGKRPGWSEIWQAIKAL
jgi:ABC-2 type transport system permease protein